MTRTQAHEILWEYFKNHFVNETVIFAKQSRTAKPPLPLVVISPGKIERQKNPNYEIVGVQYITYYQFKETVEVELFTKGAQVIDENGVAVAYTNTAAEEMAAFLNYVNTNDAVRWCERKKISVISDGTMEDVSAPVNDSSYEFKAKATLDFYFYSPATGYKNEIGYIMGDD